MSSLGTEKEAARRRQREYMRTWRAKHRNRLRAAERAHRAQTNRLGPDALDLLRRFENRLDSLNYLGAAICLNCGKICDQVGHHVVRCPEKPESPAAYRERWGFGKRQTLGSPAWRARAAESARAAHAKRDPTADASAKALWAFGRANRQFGKGSVGPRRPLTKLRVGWRQAAQRKRRRLPTEDLLDLVGAEIPLEIAAKRKGYSRSGLYSRMRELGGWQYGKVARCQRGQAVAFVMAFRRWLRRLPSILGLGEIRMAFATDFQRGERGPLWEFRPLVPSLLAELVAAPGVVEQLVAPGSAAGLALANRVYLRATRRAPRKNGGRPRGRPPKQHLWERAQALRAEGLTRWKVGQILYPDKTPEAAYSAAKKLFSRHRGQKAH